jgi:hypothetical protein
MWVNVTRREGPYHVGVLDNIPLASEETDVLNYGSEVVFLPEHVIDIIPSKRRCAGNWRNGATARFGALSREGTA